MNKVIITADIHGISISGSQRNDFKQLSEEVLALYKAGAAAVHLHVGHKEDDLNAASTDLSSSVAVRKTSDIAETAEYIKEMTSAIYSQCPEILIISELAYSESRIDNQLAIIAGEPEVAVLDCDIASMGKDAINAEDNIRRLGSAMLDNGVRPVLKCCDKGMVDTAIHFYDEGWLTDPLLFLFKLGVKGGMNQSIDNLLYLKNSIPRSSNWSVIASGDEYTDSVAEAVLMGGNVSISGEGCEAAELNARVSKTTSLIRQLGRETAYPAEARAIMSLNTKYRRVIDEHLL